MRGIMMVVFMTITSVLIAQSLNIFFGWNLSRDWLENLSAAILIALFVAGLAWRERVSY